MICAVANLIADVGCDMLQILESAVASSAPLEDLLCRYQVV